MAPMLGNGRPGLSAGAATVKGKGEGRAALFFPAKVFSLAWPVGVFFRDLKKTDLFLMPLRRHHLSAHLLTYQFGKSQAGRNYNYLIGPGCAVPENFAVG